MRALTITLLSALLPLVAAALCLGAYLNYASVRTNYLELVGDRLEAAARRIASDAHTALSLGLPLAGQTTLARSLEREKAFDPALARIDVVNAAGTVMFSSDPAAVGGQDGETDLAGVTRDVPIVSMFGTLEGDVVAVADTGQVAAELDRLAGRIVRTTVLTVVLGGLAVAGLVALSVRTLGTRITAHATTAGGRLVPSDMAPTIDAIEAAHGKAASRLGVRLVDG